MATDTAPPSRNLWQLPVFLLGIAAIVGVWFGRPYWQQSAAQRYENDLTALRQALEKSPVDSGQVQTLLRKVLGVDPPAHLQKQAPFIVGSAIAAVAESTANADEAAEQWKTARKMLESAQELGLSEKDKARHQYRLAKTWAHTGEPSAKVVEALTQSLNCGDDPSEGDRMLADFYLKQSPPDPKKARDCLKDYLGHVLPNRSEVQQRQINRARLQLGNLHTQLGETEEARKVLERIGPDSPPEFLAAARSQLAMSYQAEEDWAQAVRCLEQARDVRGISSDLKADVLYRLAESYPKTGNKAAAIATLEQLRKGKGPQAFAASLRLADYLSNDPKKQDDAVAVLESAMAEFPGADKYANNLISIADARSIVEEIVRRLRTVGAFDQSVRAARAYAKMAEKGRDRELAAEALQAWGQSQLDRAPEAEPEERPRLVEDGTKHIREAAREWHQVAAIKNASKDKGDPLDRAADLYLKSGDQEEALKMLDELGLRVPDFPQGRLANVWLKKGEIYLALGNREQARICFQNGVQIAERHPSPALLKCRMRLAEVLLKSNDPPSLARIIADLEKALTDPEFTKDKAQHESALYFMADAFFQQKNYRKAEVYFRTLLDTYPDGSRYINGLFQLGQAYWFLAGQDADRCKNLKKVIDDPETPDTRKSEAEAAYNISYKQYMEWLKKAAEPFRNVETRLLSGSPNPKLSPGDAELLRKASLGAADCAFYSGEYADCITRYDSVATRYAGTVVQLEALRSMWKCYRLVKETMKAADTLTQMRTAYLQMPDAEFDGTSEVRRRDYWQFWFEEVAPLKK